MKSAVSLILPHDPLFRRITVSVIAIHLFFLLLLAFDSWLAPKEKVREKLIVRTVALGQPASVKKPPVTATPKPETKPQAQEPVAQPKIAQEQPTPPQEVVREPKQAVSKQEVVREPKKAVPKKEAPAPASAPKPAVKKQTQTKATPSKNTSTTQAKPQKKVEKAPKTVAKTVPNTSADKTTQAQILKQQELLNKARASIAKVDTNAVYQTSPSMAAPLLKSIGPLQIEAQAVGDDQETFSPREVGYIDELVSRLKLQLKLPEFGEVKVKLTLERTGKVAKVAIVSSKSQANRQYIEKNLPSLSFPPFGKNFGDDSQYTFSLALSNE